MESTEVNSVFTGHVEGRKEFSRGLGNIGMYSSINTSKLLCWCGDMLVDSRIFGGFQCASLLFDAFLWFHVPGMRSIVSNDSTHPEHNV